jgi:putative DNA primase/helicase
LRQSTTPLIEAKRRDETTFWAEFAQARPYLLGALLDIVSVALRNEAQVVLDRHPRMADFARWVTAAEPACPWPAGEFMRVYDGNRKQAIEVTLDGDPLADFIQALGRWEGISKDLLAALNAKTSENIRS